MTEDAREHLRQHLVVDEGVVLYAYPDSLGYLTLGAGRLIDKRKGGGISYSEAMYLLDNDIERHWVGLVERLPWVLALDDVRQVTLANLAFNLGVDGLLKFTNTLAAVKRGDYDAAANGVINSLWYKQVQKSRSTRLVQMMRTGLWPESQDV